MTETDVYTTPYGLTWGPKDWLCTLCAIWYTTHQQRVNMRCRHCGTLLIRSDWLGAGGRKVTDSE